MIFAIMLAIIFAIVLAIIFAVVSLFQFCQLEGLTCYDGEDLPDLYVKVGNFFFKYSDDKYLK